MVGNADTNVGAVFLHDLATTSSRHHCRVTVLPLPSLLTLLILVLLFFKYRSAKVIMLHIERMKSSIQVLGGFLPSSAKVDLFISDSAKVDLGGSKDIYIYTYLLLSFVTSIILYPYVHVYVYRCAHVHVELEPMVYARVATFAMSTLALARLESHFLCPLSVEKTQGRMGPMSQS